jgi:hypothetical protein
MGSAAFTSGVISGNTTTSTALPSSYNLLKVAGSTLTNTSGQTIGLSNGFLLLD